ncbi:MAG: chaperone NapD [Coriobacteriia bacterium]|nr:chaperone NapD [Coriobacteriia bacterium]
MVISSYVIDTIPEKCEEVSSILVTYPGVELHGQEKNRLIVTIEADSVDETYVIATKMALLDGVLNNNLIYCNFEDETLCD